MSEERVPEYEELEFEREKLLSQARFQKSSMVRLLENRDFQMYVVELQKQIDQRLNELLTQPKGADDLVQKTYNTGEMAGLKLAVDLPKVLVEYAQTSIDSARIREENNGDEKQTGEYQRAADYEPTDDTDGFGLGASEGSNTIGSSSRVYGAGGIGADDE